MANVQERIWQAWLSSQSVQHLIVYGLLPHEHKMCTVNAVLKRAPDSTIPIKSKEKLIIQCGYRRFIVNPIFSAHTNGDKHKVSCVVNTSSKHSLNFDDFSMSVTSDLAKLLLPHSMHRSSSLRHRSFASRNNQTQACD